MLHIVLAWSYRDECFSRLHPGTPTYFSLCLMFRDDLIVNITEDHDHEKSASVTLIAHWIKLSLYQPPQLCWCFQVPTKKLKKFEKEYQTLRESQLQQEDPINRYQVRHARSLRCFLTACGTLFYSCYKLVELNCRHLMHHLPFK